MGGWEPVVKVFNLAGHHARQEGIERVLYTSESHPTRLFYTKPEDCRGNNTSANISGMPISPRKSRLRVYDSEPKKQKIVLDLVGGVPIQGDIQFKFYHKAKNQWAFAKILKSGYLKPVEALSTALSKQFPLICLFRLSFHTSFIDANKLKWTLKKDELDAMFSGPAHTKMLPDEEFTVKIVFAEEGREIPESSSLLKYADYAREESASNLLAKTPSPTTCQRGNQYIYCVLVLKLFKLFLNSSYPPNKSQQLINRRWPSEPRQRQGTR